MPFRENHFIPNVSLECQFGCNIAEKVSHLFWSCSNVNDFLNDVFAMVCNTGLAFNPTRAQFIFDYHNKLFNDPKNYLVLVIKRFIWISKFKTVELSIAGFQKPSKVCPLRVKGVIQLTKQKYQL